MYTILDVHLCPVSLAELCIVDVNRDLFKIWMSVGKPGSQGGDTQGNANANERIFTVLKDIFDVSGSDHNFKGITSAVYMLCHNFTGNIRGSIHQCTVLRLRLRFIYSEF
jgi:hypothetical protein